MKPAASRGKPRQRPKSEKRDPEEKTRGPEEKNETRGKPRQATAATESEKRSPEEKTKDPEEKNETRMLPTKLCWFDLFCLRCLTF